MKRAATLAVVLLAAGCATAPSDIEPLPTDYRPMMVYSCTELAAKVAAIEPELQDYIASQNHSRVADALTWPVSTTRIFGKNRRNVEAIARLRGELIAIDKARDLKNCRRYPQLTEQTQSPTR